MRFYLSAILVMLSSVAADLSALLAQAEKRFGDVAWRSSDGETTWAHKGASPA